MPITEVVRIQGQYLETDPQPAEVRKISGFIATKSNFPVEVVRIQGQYLEMDQQPAEVRKVSGFIATKQTFPAEVVRLQGQYLETDPQPAELRKVTGFIATRKKNLPDFTKEGVVVLVEKINKTNGTKFVPFDLNLGKPVVLVNQTKNTGIVVTALPSSGYSGAMLLRYDRVEIALALGSLHGATLPIGSLTSSRDLIPEVNRLAGTRLVPQDIVDTRLVVGRNVLTVGEESVLFIPGSSIEIILE